MRENNEESKKQEKSENELLAAIRERRWRKEEIVK